MANRKPTQNPTRDRDRGRDRDNDKSDNDNVVEIDPRGRHNPMRPPTTPDGNPQRAPNPLSEPDAAIKEPPPEDGTPTPVETPPEDR